MFTDEAAFIKGEQLHNIWMLRCDEDALLPDYIFHKTNSPVRQADIDGLEGYCLWEEVPPCASACICISGRR